MGDVDVEPKIIFKVSGRGSVGTSLIKDLQRIHSTQQLGPNKEMLDRVLKCYKKYSRLYRHSRASYAICNVERPRECRILLEIY